jgi:hypothetical protein
MFNLNFIVVKLNKYLKEISYLRWYIISILIALTLSYSIYLFLSVDLISKLGQEDHFFEWLTAIFFLVSSIFLMMTFIKTKNYFFLLLSIVFFLGFGEEITWGQRIFNYSTPAVIENINVQNEFNIHNIQLFNTHNMNGSMKTGISRLLEINFLFRVFTVLFGIFLPFVVFHLKFINNITRKIKLPVPPISIGIFFIINWLVFKVLLTSLWPLGHDFQYYDTMGEIFECIAAFVILMISHYFYYKRGVYIIGMDIKHSL